jgi:hypothetical protein
MKFFTMKTRSLLINMAASILLAAALLPAAFAQQMNYQGRLTDSSGNVLQDGQYTLTFELFDDPTAGSSVWGPFLSDDGSGNGHGTKADLANGRFNVILGPNDTAGRPLAGSFVGGPRYLQITVGTQPLLPRQQILSAPEALHSINADHATLADGISGSLNVTGNFQVGGSTTLSGPVNSLAAASFGTLATGNTAINGDLNVTGVAKFGSTERQMIDIGNGIFGMGVQDSTEYFRTGLGFAWYHNGSHVKAANDPGPGGERLMTYDINGLTVFGQGYATVTFIPPGNKGNRGSHVHFGPTGDWYIRSATAAGTVYIQDQGVGGGNTSIGGNVGIGGAADFPLHVASKRNFNFNQGVGDLRNYSGGVYQHQSSADDYSIVSDGSVWAPSFQATSDRRIKSIDAASNTAKDLETVQKLKVTDYHYIDTAVNGGRAQKGFIAQEVQQLIPEAVMSGPGYIPSIFADVTKAAYETASQRITVSLSKPHGLQKGDKVRLLTEKAGALELTVTSAASAEEFTVGACEKEPGRIFVYGKHVDDLLNLNYDRIFSTGIGAIQELTKRVAQLEENQGRLAELQKKADRVDALEAQLAELKRVVATLDRPNDDRAVAAR